MSDSGDEAEEVEKPDEVDKSEEREKPDEVDEALDEDLFNPNDEADETLDEDILNPNRGILDEDLDEGFFNPNVEKSDENLNENIFNPNVDPSDERFHEEYFDPNIDPSDERFHEEYFDPNIDPSDERFHEEYFDPNIDPSDERFHEEYFDPNIDPSDEKFHEEFFNPKFDEIDESSDEQGNDYNKKNLEFDPSLDNDAGEIKDEVTNQLRRDEKNSEEDMEEVNPNVESENIGPDQSTLILHQESQEPISRDEEGNIILDADTLEFFGEHVSSQEEMEVEFLEEGLEELFNSYEEQYFEQEEGSITSHELEQDSNQERQEIEREFHIEKLEEIGNQKIEQIQEEKLNQEPLHNNGKEISQQSLEITTNKIESLLEHEEKEALLETSQKSIQEIKRDLTQEKEISLEQNQEGKQEFIQEIQPILREMDVKERYKRETGRRPIYAGKETKGFIEWKEQFKQHKQEQEQKNISLNEKKKESKEQQEEFRESREEWAEYLAISIKESEFPEEITENLDHFLDKYEKLRELLKRVKTEEISEEAYEKEVKEFEHILIEERLIARPLFMNFDWFRRYYKETIRKSGKRVAKLYISKKTREFLSYISRRIEQLKNTGNSHENAEKFEEFLENSFQIREKWAILLNNLIHKVPNKEISRETKKELETVIKLYCEIRAILFNKNLLKEDKEELIQKHIEKCNPRYFELFENLKRFLRIYDNYSRNWMEKSLFIEGKKTIKRLSQKLKSIKKENAIHQILNQKRHSVLNFKEVLRKNLYKSTELRMSEKSKIIKIIQNENFNEEDKVKLTNILSKLSTEEFISLLGKDFNPEEKSKIKIPNFKQKVTGFLKKLHSQINGTKEQKEYLWLKSIEVLNDLIIRAKRSEFIIPNDANLKVIAGAIVYAIIQSEKEIPRLIDGKEIMEKLKIKQGSVYDYYHKHFKQLYPRAKKIDQINKEINRVKNRKYTKHFFTGVKGFKKIREIISLLFFDILVEKDVETKELVSYLQNTIIDNTKLPIKLTQDDILILQKLNNHTDFNKYFSDLAEIIKYFIISSKTHKIIGARIKISYIAKTLIKKGVNLFKTSKTFPTTLTSIFDCLKENYDDFFPARSSIEYTTIEKRERWAIDIERAYIKGSRIKVFVIKNIYSGKYNKNGKIQCSECNKEGFTINTDISRLEAMEFNHISGNKIYEYTTKDFYHLFTQSYGDPYFLEKLIFKMESEKVELICKNHHNLHHSKYFKYFKYLINWNELFSLSPILIHLIIRISVNSFYLTKNLPKDSKKNIRRSILIDLKRRYIINILYSGKCPICEEFTAKDHISVFQGHHETQGIKKQEVSYLFNIGLSCSEIVKILEAEHVGLMCGNCHTVIQYIRDISILNQIYDDVEIVNRILDDYKQVLSKFKPINDEKSLINDPLKKIPMINDNIIKYLFAIHNISKAEQEINATALSNYLGVSARAVRHFFYDRYNLLNLFINVLQEKPKTLKKYSLTDYGKKAITLLQHFRDYYNSLS